MTKLQRSRGAAKVMNLLSCCHRMQAEFRDFISKIAYIRINDGALLPER